MNRAPRPLNLETRLLSGQYKWEGHLPATEEDVDALVAASFAPLPPAYLALLRLSDGGEAELSGNPSDVRIWPARTAIAYNRDYEVQKGLPGFVAFGDSGGPDMVGFDVRGGEPYPVCAIPFAPMEWEAAMGRVPSFEAFLGQLLPTTAAR